MDWTQEEFPPKVGQEKTVTVSKITKVETLGHEKNFTRLDKTDPGYHYQIDLADGKVLYLNTWKLLDAFRKANVQEGQTIKISHPEKGSYVVTKDGSPSEVAWDDEIADKRA